MLKPLFAAASGLAVATVMTGCTGYGQPPAASGGPAAAPSGGLCNAQAAQFAVGQSSTASVMESARARSGAHMARILRPGQMVTQEFDAQRLNLEVNSSGRIVAVRCG